MTEITEAKTINGWADCPGCARERRTDAYGTLVAHRAWNPARFEMLPCPGSGQLPVTHDG
jgi:hypothetical protein